jgi:hypothetical protein
LWVTNLPASLRGWRAQPAYIDAAHRVHARMQPEQVAVRNPGEWFATYLCAAKS